VYRSLAAWCCTPASTCKEDIDITLKKGNVFKRTSLKSLTIQKTILAPHLLEAWKDSLQLLPEEGSLQLGQGNLRAGKDSPLRLEGNRPLREGIRQPELGILLPVGGSRLAVGGSRLAVGGSRLAVEGSRLPVEGSPLPVEGSRLPVEGSRLLGVEMPLVEAGSRLPVVGIHQTEEGILGSSSSESRG